MIYTYQMLQEKYNNYGNPKTKIQRLVKSNKLLKLGKGIYDDNIHVDPILLSNVLYSPSYVSFETALYIYGLIPERVVNITCATYNKNKKKIINTPIATYIYQDININAYPHGNTIIEQDGYSYMIALPEKALLDTISKGIICKNIKEMYEYLFDDLRINEILFDQLDKSKLNELSKYYRSNNIRIFINMINKEYNND